MASVFALLGHRNGFDIMGLLAGVITLMVFVEPESRAFAKSAQ